LQFAKLNATKGFTYDLQRGESCPGLWGEERERKKGVFKAKGIARAKSLTQNVFDVLRNSKETCVAGVQLVRANKRRRGQRGYGEVKSY
jgi:hypothetical protein